MMTQYDNRHVGGRNSKQRSDDVTEQDRLRRERRRLYDAANKCRDITALKSATAELGKQK